MNRLLKAGATMVAMLGTGVALTRHRPRSAAGPTAVGRHAGSPLPLETELALSSEPSPLTTARHAGEPRDEVVESVEATGEDVRAA